MEANKATKVKLIESYKDSQGLHTVVKGKVVLIKDNRKLYSGLIQCITDIKGFHNIGDIATGSSDSEGVLKYWKPIKPIIISEIDQQEQLIKGDSILFSSINGSQEICKYVEDDGYGMGVIDSSGSRSTISYSKTARILALPEQFSPKQLQAIVDGKLKDGDDVYVECNNVWREEWNDVTDEPFMMDDYYINLTNNYIKLFPVKESISLEKALNQYVKDKHSQEECIGFIDGFNQAQSKSFPVKKEASWDEIWNNWYIKCKAKESLCRNADFFKYGYKKTIIHQLKNRNHESI